MNNRHSNFTAIIQRLINTAVTTSIAGARLRPVTSQAQEAGLVLEEILVTATRRAVGTDIQTTPIESACAVVMNYPLQFVAPEQRLKLLSRIRAGLQQDGALIVSEKIRFADRALQAYFDEAHLDFKRANGYSDLEISQKRTALEDVMKPDTLEPHQARFADAGFSKVDVWFRCLNWASFIARP